MKIAIAAQLSEPQNQLFYRRLAQVSQPFELERVESVDPRGADLAYMCGLPASELLDTHRPLVAPVLGLDRYQQKPWYFVDVIGREPTIEGRRWAFNEKNSFSGWLAVRHGLGLKHIDPDLLEWTATGSHAASVEAVRTGRADLAGIDSMILDLIPELAAGLTLVDSWGPWPTPPVMVIRSLDPSLVDDLVAAFVGTDDDVTWVPITDDHLAPITATIGP